MSAQHWIQHLGLQPHPEGGYFKETYKAAEGISQSALPDRFPGNRSFGTAIYFLLETGNFSAFHRLQADEVWHFYDGVPLALHMIDPGGAYRRQLLGLAVARGALPQLVVPAGTWFGAAVTEPDAFTLVGCTMAPGFEFADFDMPEREVLGGMFPQHQEIISRLTRS